MEAKDPSRLSESVTFDIIYDDETGLFLGYDAVNGSSDQTLRFKIQSPVEYSTEIGPGISERKTGLFDGVPCLDLEWQVTLGI